MTADFNLALEITAITTRALKQVNELDSKVSAIGGKKSGGFLDSMASQAGRIAGTFTSVTSTLIGGAFKFGSMLISFISKGVDMLLGIPKQLAIGIAAGAAAIYGAHKALSPAGEMERYKTQLGVLGKGDLLPFYKQTAAKTPFSMNEVVQSGILMESFGIASKRFLKTAIDAAAAFKKPVEEVIRTLGYAKAGRSGEAIESAASMGISRKDLMAFGIRFGKSGEALNKDAVFGALTKLLEKRYGGMSEKMSGTYEGLVSNLGDAIFQAMANAGEDLLPKAKETIQLAIKTIENVDWKGVGERISSIISTMFTTDGRKALLDVAVQAWKGLSIVGNAVAGDIKTIFTWLINNIPNALVNGWNAAMSQTTGSIGTAIKDAGMVFINMLMKGILEIATQVSALLGKAVMAILPEWAQSDKMKKYSGMSSSEIASDFAANDPTYGNITKWIDETYKPSSPGGKPAFSPYSNLGELNSGKALMDWIGNTMASVNKATGGDMDAVKSMLRQSFAEEEAVTRKEGVKALKEYVQAMKDAARAADLQKQKNRDLVGDLVWEVPSLELGYN